MLVRRTWACVVAVIAATALACGPTTRASGPARPTRVATFRAVTPLGFGAEARAAAWALILGADPRGGATAVPLAGGPREVTVDVVGVRGGPTPVGVVRPVVLTTAPSTDGQLRVSFSDAARDAPGPSAQAAVWRAAQVAASVLDKDLTDISFAVAGAGAIDDGAASALLTAGFLAALLGGAVDPRATLIGVINPDGSIGPVAGLPQRLDAAIAAGKQRIGYPAGMGQTIDEATGQPVDIAARAAAQGAVAVELADIGDALALLTGVRLPRPLAVAEADLALDDAEVTELGLRYDGWHQRLAADWTQVLVLLASGRLPAPLAALAAEAEHETARADGLHQRGQAAAAYHHVIRAWIAAASAIAVSAVVDRVRLGDLAGARTKLDELAAMTTSVDDSLGAIGRLVPDTMASHLQMISAYEQSITGWGLRALAEHQLAVARATLDALADADRAVLAARATADEVAAAVVPAVRNLARAVAAGTAATEALTIEGGPAIAYQCAVPAIGQTIAAVRAAARADLAAYQARFVDLVAGGDAARAPDELLAILAVDVDDLRGLPPELAQAWGEDSITRSLFGLAASEVAWSRAAVLVSRVDALGLATDAITGPPTESAPAALARMLTTAERHVREQAGAARIATGAIPIQTRLGYQRARALADGDLADQRAALEAYWAAARFADTAVMLARHPR